MTTMKIERLGSKLTFGVAHDCTCSAPTATPGCSGCTHTPGNPTARPRSTETIDTDGFTAELALKA